MTLLSIAALKKAVRESSPATASVHAQVEKISRKEASNGKPFQELQLRDGEDSMTLRAWNDTPAYEACENLSPGTFVAVEGVFSHSAAFGLDGRRWEIFPIDDKAVEDLLEGTGDRRLFLEHSQRVIDGAVATLRDPRLRTLCLNFLDQYGQRFRRAAAARGNHHARRGGLLEHTSRMMEAALALCGVYHEINRDLLIAGVLFHDSGKLWETCPPERGFGIKSEPRGELLGHLSIGIELVNSLWRDLPKEDWEELSPSSDDVRIHLLHLIASHHGQLEFGSPVLPKTPEAALLHFIDNIDARMEMFAEAYRTASPDPLSPLDRVRSLGVSPVRPLPLCEGGGSTASAQGTLL